MRALAIVLLLAACGPEFTIHERTAPRRVDVTKQASKPRLVFAARLVTADTIELVAKHASDVRISRVVHYGAASFDMSSGMPLVELLEIPLGLLFLIVGPAAWETPYKIKSTSTTKAVFHNNWIVAMLSPFQSAFWYKVEANPTSNADVFEDPPVTREFEMRLPVRALAATFRVLDEGERAIASGSVQTDELGRATIASASGAIAIEVTSGGTTTIVPVEPFFEETP